MKRNYTTPETSIYDTKLRMSVLVTGSKTDTQIMISNVEVHEFENGFGANDFGTITFD